jgi:hypothetical protein
MFMISVPDFTCVALVVHIIIKYKITENVRTTFILLHFAKR